MHRQSGQIQRIALMIVCVLPLGGCYTVGARYPYGYNPYVYTYPTPVTYYPQSNYGADSATVYAIQVELIRIGYLSGNPNSMLDARTRAAIRRAQILVGMNVDGIPNDELLRALRSVEGQRIRQSTPTNSTYNPQPQIQDQPRSVAPAPSQQPENRSPSEPGQVQRNRDLLKQMDNLE